MAEIQRGRHAMTLKNYVCWQPEALGRVLDTEALEVPDDVFLATHYPLKLYRQDLLQASAQRAVYEEEDFLRDFARPANFALVPVLGEAGTGKSHLIRWLAARLREEPSRRVVLIPRSGTNLRNVIRQILGDLPGKRLDEFRHRLQEETGQLTPARAAEMLLDKLALEVGLNGLHEGKNLDELQTILLELLPPLFRDSIFRRHFLASGGIIERLCEHIVGLGTYIERLTERRRFTLDDLPLNVVNSTRASRDAQDCYSQLQNNPDLRIAAVDWINLNLDAAIASLLQLRGETLSDLMLEVRETMFESQTELVILIEDFAKLQGIDRQLLDALLVKTNQPDRKPLCTMRTAFGCTTGYFKGFAETLLQRLDFVIYTDPSATESGAVADIDVEGFVARYLNAVRLGSDEIAAWYRSSDSGSHQDLPSACVSHECPHHAECHAAFGSTGDVGLYPFTSTALRRMLERASPRGFNPRLLINKVLKHTLVTYGPDLASGHFPPAGLRAHFGGSLDPILRKKAEDADPEHSERRLTLIDLWTDADDLVDLDPRIHAAFDLPSLRAAVGEAPRPAVRVSPAVSGPTAPATRSAAAVPAPTLPPALLAQLRELDEWSSNNAKLSYDLTNHLRGLLYDAITLHVDWDSALLLKGDFCGGKDFSQTHINFQNQAAVRPARHFVLLVPADIESLSDAAVALKGLLLFRHHRNWKFKDGAHYFRVYSKYLHSWGRQVLAFARSTRVHGQEWNPVPAAIELLALDARLSGRVSPSKPTVADYVNGLFSSPLATTSGARSKSWSELQGVLREARPKLQRLVISRTACTKGGSSAVKVVDAIQYVAPIQALRREWRLTEAVPQDLRDEYKFLVKVRERIDASLDRAIDDEKARHIEWLATATAELGESPKRDDLVLAVQEAGARAQAEGVYVGNPSELEAAVERMKTMRLDQLLSAARRIRDAVDRADLVLDLSLDRSETMDAVTRFILTARSVVEASRKRLDTEIANLESKGGAEVEQSTQAIAAALSKMSTLLVELAGSAT
jgi:hypothetical protein